jgi:predicted O-methyltransferase YrrM
MVKVLRLPYSKMQRVELAISRPICSRALTVPKIKTEEIISGPIEVALIDLGPTNGNTSSLEQLILLSIAKQRKCKRIFEMGTFDGRTSANLALNLPDAEIFTIDLPADQADTASLPIGRHDLPYIKKNRIGGKAAEFKGIIQLQGDTAKFDFSTWYGTCDLVFVDACHEYEYVLNDSEIALKLLAQGGIALWHDYGSWTGVTRALNQLHERDPRFQGRLRFISETTLCALL